MPFTRRALLTGPGAAAVLLPGRSDATALQTFNNEPPEDLVERFRECVRRSFWQFDDVSYDRALIRHSVTEQTYVIHRQADGSSAIQNISPGPEPDPVVSYATQYAAPMAVKTIEERRWRHKGAILFQFLVGESWPPRSLVTMNAKPIRVEALALSTSSGELRSSP
jgi:hypothetical protein